MKAINSLPSFNKEHYIASIPGSKSYTDRGLILATQRMGIPVVKSALICDDIIYLAEALNQLEGLTVQREDGIS